MAKKTTKFIIIVTLVLVSALTVACQNSGHATTNAPTSLRLYIGPTSVPADNGAYNCIFIQLLDANSQPARAVQNITVGLSSSLTSIGTVPPSITIPEGATYASASFQTTFTPGTTTIAASASGFATVQSTITTVGPIPTAVALYGFPSTLPADGNTYDSIVMQLQDSSGAPAVAPIGGIQVSLSCSNTNVGSVTSTVTIPGGQTYTTASFTTVVNNATQSAIITSVAQGYSSQQLTVKTTPIATAPTNATNQNQLKIFSCPELPADNSPYQLVAVELQSSGGYIFENQSYPTDVSLSSTNLLVGQINSQLTIPAGQAYAVTTLNTTYVSSSTTITAVANSFLSSQQTITTTGFTPTKLAVFCVPSALPSDNATYTAIQVQLQDSQGRPAQAPTGDVTVDLFSSTPTVGAVGSTLVIPFGQTEATGTIKVTNSPGATSITAQTSGYTTGQATMQTYLIDYLPLQVTLTADNQTLTNAEKTSITAYVTADDTPVTGATVQFTSDNGGTFTTTQEEGGGYYTTTFTAASYTIATTCTITANATKTEYISSQATTLITVQPPISPPSTATNETTKASANATQSASSKPSVPQKIQLLVTNSEGNALAGVTVLATAQPSGTDPLTGETNSTGYVVFQNVTAGDYTFRVSKDGYLQTFEPIALTDKPVALALTLSKEGNGSGGFPLLTIIIIGVVIAVVVFVAILILNGRGEEDSEQPPLRY